MNCHLSIDIVNYVQYMFWLYKQFLDTMLPVSPLNTPKIIPPEDNINHQDGAAAGPTVG